MLTVVVLALLSCTAEGELSEQTWYCGESGSNVTAMLRGNLFLTVSGTGAMANYYFLNDIPWWDSRAAIKTVKIENGVTSIGEHAFYDCSNLVSVTIPNSITAIGNSALSACDNLVEINVNADNTTFCSVDGVVYNKDKTTLLIYPGGKLKHFNIPNSVTTIGECAFIWCSNLNSITIPNSVTSIGDQSFAWCLNLNSLAIPNSVNTISDYAFRYSGLTEIINYTTTPQTVNTNVFQGINKTTCIIRVPATSVSIYKAARGWRDFENIVALP